MLFVHHSNTKEVLNRLSTLFILGYDSRRGMTALYGCAGVGKSHLLAYLSSEYWGEELHVQVPRIIRITIDEHKLGSLKGKGAVYATAEACVTFSAIAEELGALSAHCDSESIWAKCSWYKQPRPLYTDHAFLSLAAFVKSELRRLRVAGIIIDNAHRIDTYSVRQLVQTRALLNGQLALIFCAPIEKPLLNNERLEGLIAKSGAADEFETPIELQQLEETAFTGAVLNDLLAHLNAVFAPDLPPLTKALIMSQEVV